MKCDMPRSLEDKIKSLPKKRQQKIQQRTNDLIAEKISLCDIRKTLKQTQEDLGNIHATAMR
ncbi:putative transcriptional regulator, XRE family [Legionella spiritensis]|nr:putative transcriptional regulator, XRE family [Legionella spiritensis]